MSLATRCPTCGTVFRVVQDQLKVSQGWVRCGHCQDVFNALEALFELTPPPREPFRIPAPPPEVDWPPVPEETTSADEATTPSPSPAAAADLDADSAWLAPPAASQAEAAAQAHVPPTPSHTDDSSAPDQTNSPDADAPPPSVGEPQQDPRASDDRIEPVLDEHIDEEARSTLGLPTASAPPPAAPELPQVTRTASTPATAEAPQGDPSLSFFDGSASLLQRPLAGAPATITQIQPFDAMAAPVPSPPPAAATSTAPTFIQRAERAAIWRRPMVRLGLLLLLLLLSLTLLGQVAWQLRDELGARHPDWRPWLQPAVEALGEPLRPPRALDRLVLDASNLGRTGSPQILRLTAEVRNSASHAVQAPSLDVSFSDVNGQLLVRRVFTPEELGLNTAEIAADSPWNIDTRLDVGPLRVVGYKLDLFYP